MFGRDADGHLAFYLATLGSWRSQNNDSSWHQPLELNLQFELERFYSAPKDERGVSRRYTKLIPEIKIKSSSDYKKTNTPNLKWL